MTLNVSPLDTVRPKPFIKWVGGKRQLLPELQRYLPEKITDYFEPFIGGGALLWTLDPQQLRSITINDYNAELVNAYQVVRDKPRQLLDSLAKHRNTETYYYEQRALDRQDNFNRRTAVTRASRFIYLNKTGYNGLYRVNSKGQHNVPFGRYANPTIVDSETIYACSAFLQHVQLMQGDFDAIRPLLSADAFVYLDPPYAPVSATANFTSYTDQGFDHSMQQRLKELCDYIDAIGAKFMLSNSAAPLIYKLYQDYEVIEVQASRAVNSKASGRGKVTELIVRNYQT
ncbi:DNA adenine methylase [Thiopseudomonas acetoxidans]|uniref:Site-specific DNA-methyltransferase (adenine-specific) n=1 Tax=Thiopseudomonas acetoxidans TaxID=3041622 RepID=A0ABT7SPH3_9GAMM|nr:DNA adenine methylase [Thiopseudomonas sp. CY1220]MDM7858087.1 DNA adenine methylase [Thiopseudomonas sp. CY1220]